MKTLLILLIPAAFAANRADECFAMRGNRTPEAIASMTRWLEDPELRSCAAQNLQAIEAIEPLRAALNSKNPETRAAAARMLGTFRRNDLIDDLATVAA